MKHLLSLTALALALAPLSALAQGADPNGQPAPVVGQAPAPGAPAAVTPDKASAPAEEAPKPLMWRGTSFTWTQNASTSLLGIGTDQVGFEEDVYAWDFILSPQIYLLDLEKDKILAFAEGGVSVEWTDSGSTTTKHEPAFRDTQVGVGYNRNIFKSEDNEWSTDARVRLRYNIPTSKISLEQGRYGVLSPGVSLSQQFKLLGQAAKGLNSLTLTAGFTWSHLFAKSYTPTNPNLQRTRQSVSGTTREDDQLSFRSMDIDRLIPSATIGLPIYGGLELTAVYRLIGRFKHDFESGACEIVVMGECQTADRDPNRVNYVTDSSFDISLSQPIYDMFTLNLGYNNESLTLDEASKLRNPFWSPGGSVFYLDLVANIDVIYDKASGRSKIDLPPGPNQNATAASNAFGMPSF
ncbi:MAG: hypothetical protein HOW73_05505 [Polyangiaceae bacterium]|nr:hypothetical protein [Polyangiaceae bacterium]